MLIDDVVITIRAGRGGDGAVSLKRNAQTPRGGPDGGNGGNGGDVYVQGSRDVSDLRQFQFKKKAVAEDGVAGAKNNLYGRNGGDLIIKLPLGTRITELPEGKVYEILDTENQLLLARGGKGGRGNNEFKTATNQAPRFAERGEEGEEKELRLELRLIADIGLIGLPNAGKSSLLSVLTHAQPKIGDYPFTTLEPNLGALEGLIIADIPGLIAGASTGKGLGTKFLKHIEKTALLIHCLAATNQDLKLAYTTVRKELEGFHKELAEKPEVILITKTDLIDADTLQEMVEGMQAFGRNVLTVSMYDDESVENLKTYLFALTNTDATA